MAEYDVPLVLLLALLGGLVVVALAEENGHPLPETTVQPSDRANFVLQKQIDYQTYLKEYNKHYSSLLELARRTKLFMVNAWAVYISRLKYFLKKATTFLKITSRTDWTVEEREASRNHDGLLKRPAKFVDFEASGAEFVEEHERKKRATDPSKDQVYLDYRLSNCFTPIKDQDKCGACYIFATTALLEYHHCKQTGKLVPFSEQYAIDCGPSSGVRRMGGCDGGQAVSVGTFYSQYGIKLADAYPYRGQDGECAHNAETSAKPRDSIRVDSMDIVLGELKADLDPNNIKMRLERDGPLFVSMDISDDFDFYGGGVDVPKCPRYQGHSMVLIGDGYEDGLEYWLARNSNGPDFGMEGHYKFAKESGGGCVYQIGYVRGQFTV